MGNAEERPRTDNRQNIGCTEMRIPGLPGSLSFYPTTTPPTTTTTPSAKVLEVVGINLHQTVAKPLDTLAQLATERKILQKRARSKYITNNISIRLADLKSEMEKSYWNSFHCCETLTQSGQSVIGKYCNNRWCLTCNRIRTAKLINGYAGTLKALTDKQFVTLTIPNVPGPELEQSIIQMQKEFRLIQKLFQIRRKTPIVGIRKIEVTFNPTRNDFHPHFHLVVSGSEIASAIINEWLKRFPSASRQAQDERPADDNSTMELFKYFTKIITKKHFYIDALDTIFKAMRNKRTFQPMGIKKIVSEDIAELQAIIYNDLEPREAVWTWIQEATDWIDQKSGETLTGYSPSEAVKNLLTADKFM